MKTPSLIISLGTLKMSSYYSINTVDELFFKSPIPLSFPNHKKIIPILRRWLESVENPAKRRHHSPNILHGNTQNGNSKRRKRTTISSNSKVSSWKLCPTNSLSYLFAKSQTLLARVLFDLDLYEIGQQLKSN